MLPFLKNKNQSVAGLIIQGRKPDEKPEDQIEQEEDSSAIAIEACAEELIKAIHDKDVKAAAQAIKDAFTILESLPHQEEPHETEEEYE